MSVENVEDDDLLDAEFFMEVDQLTLTHISSSASALPPQPPQSHNISSISYSPPRQLSQRTSAISDHSRSSTDNAKDLEINLLKRELERVSKQLGQLEHECHGLKKERNKKEEQIKFASSKNDKKDAVASHLKGTNLKDRVTAADLLGVSQKFQTVKALDERVGPQINEASSRCKEIGIQTNFLGVSQKFQTVKALDEQVGPQINEAASSRCKEMGIQTDLLGVSQEFQTAKALDEQVDPQINKAASSRCKEIGIQADLLTHLDLSQKLQDIWGFPSDQMLGKNLISKLFVACSLEFHVLFDCMSINTSSKHMNSLAVETSADVASQNHLHSYPSAEAAKVSQLYSVLTKGSLRVKDYGSVIVVSVEQQRLEIGNGMVQLEALVEPLLDLCGVENVVIVNRSLRILHVFLKHLLTLERKAEVRVYTTEDLICTLLRDNVMIEGHLSRNNIGDFHGASNAKNSFFCRRGDEASCAGCVTFGIRSPEADTVRKKAYWSPGRAACLSYINWVSIFELMNQIAMRNTEEYVRSEAVSIMNLIVLSSHSYMDREKFGQPLVFDNISKLLKKEAGLHVQKEALHLLYVLLNCPKIFVAFCSDCEEEENAGAANESCENPSAKKASIMILEGLANCIACSGSGVQDLELRRNAVVVLAFLASSGKCGFEVLVNHKLHEEANFLMLILQVLVSEIDMEAAADNVKADIFRARTLLIREALILLNRLVSNPAYAAIVLQVLTSTRDMAALTIDVANTLSREDRRMGKSDSITRQIRKSEVVDLGRVFRRRVFTYLGDRT
ncbi:hypothetical protein EZV62_019473 [Acer yangbiense]|uniref:Uncharacterized protein n=1 Tax=Acer yangbiense TaxID=1000413 RepID=A0A5C7HBC2_9ROSI|nr:hypothetical protein EZV62_019473 [Acer yangbiense]